MKKERGMGPGYFESVEGMHSVKLADGGMGEAHLCRYIPAAMAERQKFASRLRAQRGRGMVW